MPRQAVIVGGGIGGLTTAIALQRAGLKVSVFERAPEITAIGAGITLTQSASRGLYALGLKEQIIAGSDNPGVLGLGRRRPMYRDDASEGGEGTPEPELDPPFFLQIHRADLYMILYQAVLATDPDAVHLGHEFDSYEETEDGVTAHFKNGVSASGDILIGADGVRSMVRERMLGPEEPRFTGQVCYRCLIPLDSVSQYLTDGPTFGYHGPGRHVLRYVIRHGTVLNVVAFVRTDTWTGEGYSAQTTPDELLSHFPGWDEKVLGLFRNAPPEGTAKWALYDRDPIQTWTKGRVALMGDAAHPMLPFLGLGAATAIEDAVVLGRAIAQEVSAPRALDLYEGTRRNRANWILVQARLQGELTQGEDRETLDRTTLPSADPTLYDYDPSMTPLQSARVHEAFVTP